jgi:epoxyqueuosine reductase
LERIESQTGKLEGSRMFVDSAPVLDRAWAVRCGLGFIGKNTTLIHPKKGSFFFIGHLFLPIELTKTGQELTNRCGHCTKCLDACPTGALEAPFQMDARKCISYLTIEYKGSIDSLDPNSFKGWMYGCDICQDVCPYNRFSLPNLEPQFQPSEPLMAMRENDWKNLTKADFDALFKRSAVQRAGFEGLKRNIEFLSSNKLRDAVCDNDIISRES